ncbi:caspase family protein [Fodinibius salsisoli]|uniref:Caspase family protein n=1 Tax=Fodinibius salsisoli TaxID=2820877 RepID=A0ABT3PPP8_9BACT|nr:caspase family protein [Fodinibius salsisoli]MCW9707821.1 caspase family protein [Fodinibius salsisoli]
MKFIVSAIFVLLFFSMNWQEAMFPEPVDSGAPEKYALVFAIGDYPESGGWGKISSGNDVPLILSTLEKQGFKSKNITVVRDEMATKEGIKKTFDEQLMSKIKTGDVVYVHFSSHGQQVIDNNEDEVDGFDEAVIPYDANLSFEAGVYEGEKHLRDDELGEIFSSVRTKLGPEGNLLVLIDACHSGTGTRGIAKARGTQQKMAPEGYKVPIAASQRNTRGQQSFMEAGHNDNQNLAPMVTISGASADELNYEIKDDNGNGVGSLSYTFSKVMSHADKKMSYRELFDRIKIEMQKRVPNQTPQIEGALDQELFGGAFIESEPYFLPDYWEDNTTAFLKAGTLKGLFDSTRVAVFNLSAQDLANADTLAEGYILDATLTESFMVLDEPMTEEDPPDLKVVISGQNYASLKVKVKLDLAMSAAALSKIHNSIRASGAGIMVDRNPDLVITNKGISRSGAIEIFTPYDQSLGTIEVEGTSSQAMENAANTIVETVKENARINFLRNLEMEDDRRAVSVEIVPLKGKVTRGRFKEEGEIPLGDFRDTNGNIVFEEGQVFKLRVKNKGYRKAYFTILDFTPDGGLSLVAPNKNSSMQPADYIIDKGQTTTLKQLFIMQAPHGNEMFKVIATEEPLDLRPIIDPIRGTRAGSGSPFQRLMKEAASTTRAGSLSMGGSSANISSFSFKVVPKNKEF